MVTATVKGQSKEGECGNEARHKFIVGRGNHLPLQEGDTIKTAVTNNGKVI